MSNEITTVLAPIFKNITHRMAKQSIRLCTVVCIKKKCAKCIKKKNKVLFACIWIEAEHQRQRKTKKERKKYITEILKKKNNMVYYTQKITVMIFSFSESMLKEIMFDINFYTPHLSRNDGI